jgi:hypothetical protein
MGSGHLAVAHTPRVDHSNHLTREQPVNSNHLRLAALLLAVAGLPAGAALASPVTGTNTFTAGTPIRAADVNANFTAVKAAVDDNASRITALEATSAASRLTALEAALAARQSHHSAQGATDANGSIDDVWVDVVGTALPVTLTTAANVRYQLFARLYNYGAAAGSTTNCSVRLVLDAANTPINPVTPSTAGDWNSTLVGGAGTPGNDKQVALGGLVNLAAGDYVFKAQVLRQAKAAGGTSNSGNCSIFRWSFSRAQLFVDLVP